ncbi:MAG: riboflavin synthase [Pseudomonadota bacterium]|nr:riboflavin synthase [Pseudomonadota bacterium]
MFTGIVAAVGRIVSLAPLARGVRLTIDGGGLSLADTRLGDSICVNGACLTAVELAPGAFVADVSRETLDCTVGLDQAGAEVNLEKSLTLADRLGGHLVSGHVDGVGLVSRFEPVGESWLLEIAAPDELARYIARKGSVTVNGVSLTVNHVRGARFDINIIPHTRAVTTFRNLATGQRVNLEVDLIARYCERLLSSAGEDV